VTLSARSQRQALGIPIPGRARFRVTSWLRGWLVMRWRYLTRSRPLPAGLRSLVTIERGERVLSAGRDPDDGYTLLATDRALHHRTAGGGWSRLGWEQITRVSWDGAADSLVIVRRSGVAAERIVLPLRDRGTIPELILERVTHTRLGCWHVPLADGKQVLAEARRRPATGELLWFVSRDGSGLDLSADGVPEHVKRAIARLGTDLGIIGRLRSCGTEAAAE
jgi:hypothetical protein